MHRSIMAGLLLLATGVLACGDGSATGTAPTLSDLSFNSTTVAPSSTITRTMKISDPDGLGGMTVTLSLTGPASAQSTIPVQSASDAVTSASVPFVVALSAATPTGTYTFTVTATDSEGNDSNALSGTVTVQ